MLKPNHQKALQLFRENFGSVEEIAKACSLTPGYLYDLIESAPHTGQLGVLFSSEYKKIIKECSKRTSNNLVTLKDRLVEDLLKWNAKLNELAPDPNSWSLKQVYAKKAILAEINKVDQGGVSIGEFHYHTGLAGEDLVNEFKRVRSLVDFAAHGSRVPAALSRGSGVLPLPAETTAGGAEAEEASHVSAESEAGALSQVGSPRKGRPRGK